MVSKSKFCVKFEISSLVAGLSSTERIVGGPHTGVADLETTVVMATRGL